MPAPLDPNAPPPTLIFTKFDGIKNTIGAERLTPQELERAINVDLDDAGQLRRRRGYRKVDTNPHHSLFTADDGAVYGVRAGVLGRIYPDYSFAALESRHVDPLWYTQIGPDIYYSSRSRSGIITQGVTDTISAWGSLTDLWLSPVVNPTATLPAIGGTYLGAPKLSTCHAYWNGRIYLGSGREVWATELYRYKFRDKTRNYWTFEADITMIGAVTDGLYVGTEEGVWFVGGPSYDTRKRQRVMDSGVVPGSLAYVPAELANPPQIPLSADTEAKVSILFLTSQGYCGGQDSGVCYNFTENKVVFPRATRAAAMFRRQDGVNQYIAVTENGGTPSANTRLGDYVDAEIRRGGASWPESEETVRLGDRVEATIV